MAIVRVPQLGRTFIMPAEIETFLADAGVEYQRWTRVHPIPAFSSAEEILRVYKPELESYKKKKNFHGYNVLDLTAKTPQLKSRLRAFKGEHWHTSDEARFLVLGRGICYVHPAGRGVIAVEMEPGDLISIGPGVRHWFDLCAEKRFRAIQFSSKTEETVYSGSGIEAEYEPVYLGLAYFPAERARAVGR